MISFTPEQPHHCGQGNAVMGSTWGNIGEVTEEAPKISTEQMPALPGLCVELGFDDIVLIW